MNGMNYNNSSVLGNNKKFAEMDSSIGTLETEVNTIYPADSSITSSSTKAAQTKAVYDAITSHNTSSTAHNDIRTQLASPFNFKGSVSSVGDLPSNGNTINDTYYVMTATCLYSWNGSAWSQSSLEESDYLEEITEIKNALSDVMSMERIDIQTIWEQGSLSGAQEIVSAIRIRTKYIDISNYTKIGFYVDSDYLYSLYTYDADGTVVDDIPWSANSANVVPGTGAVKMRVLLCKSGNVNIVPSEGIHLTMRAYYALYNVVDDLNSNAFKYGGYVNSSTLDSLLPDANNAAANSFYVLRFTESDGTNITAHLPFTQTKNGLTDLLVLVTYNSPVYYLQLLFDRVGSMYTRFGANTSYSPWYNKTGGYTIHVGPGYQWTKLTDAIKFAFDNPNTTVIVHPAIYDIVAEMGDDYWANFSGYADLTHAKIGNGAHFIFSPDARVVCQYTGSNTTVNTIYSPLNSLDGSEGDFTIEGMNLIVSGCRYAIHDDVGASTVEQTHRYINCDITNDKRCIGAGLGVDMTVEMRDCVFRSSASYEGNNPVSWHNSGAAQPVNPVL